MTSNNYVDYEVAVTIGVKVKETVTINVTGADRAYDGTAWSPTGITVADDKVAVDDLEKKYTGRDGTVYTESSTAPKDAGKYTLIVKVKDSNNLYTGESEEYQF